MHRPNRGYPSGTPCGQRSYHLNRQCSDRPTGADTQNCPARYSISIYRETMMITGDRSTVARGGAPEWIVRSNGVPLRRDATLWRQNARWG